MEYPKDFDKNHMVIITQIEKELGNFENNRVLSLGTQKVWQDPIMYKF